MVFSEYNLIECAYLFQTNLSKQWIENIRTTKVNFQLLMEESKMKLQNAHNHPIANPNSSTSTVTTSSTTTTTTTSTSTLTTNSNSTLSTIHQSLPSLSSTSETSLDLPALKLGGSSVDNSSSTDERSINASAESIRRSSKVESDVFKTVEQPRRNSRTDHKNYGRYFTADGTGTHGTNPSSSSSLTNPSSMKSTPSTAIIKRMSWNNEPINTNNSTNIPTNELSNTNSFRSVHSSSGVSSTGSFLFSADEESSITTAASSSIPLISSSIKTKTDSLTDDHDEIDGKSSSSTVIGAEDREQIISSLISQEQPEQKQSTSSIINSNDLNRTEFITATHGSPKLTNRLSASSTTTLTNANSSTTIGLLTNFIILF